MVSNTKNVLIIKHYEKSPGGTDLNVKTIIKLAKSIRFYILFSFRNKVYLEKYERGNYINTLEFSNNNKESFLKNLLKEIINVLDIHLVHFHHLYNLDNEIMRVPKEQGLQTILTVHDVSYLNDKAFLEKYLNIPDLIIFPSEFLYGEYKKYVKSKSKIIEHGINLRKIIKREVNEDKRLNIGFMGLLSSHKGIETFLELIQNFKSENLFSWFAFGNEIREFSLLIKKFKLKRDVDIKTFPYENSNPQSLIQKYDIDLFIFPSTIPESYGYTLSESWQSGVPVVVFDTGALSDRVKRTNGGFIYKNFSELIKLLISIDKNKKLLNEKIKRVNKIRMKSSDEMVEEYETIYKKLCIEKTNNSEIEDFSYKYKVSKNPEILTLGDKMRKILRIIKR